jgi:hypothetical protein
MIMYEYSLSAVVEVIDDPRARDDNDSEGLEGVLCARVTASWHVRADAPRAAAGPVLRLAFSDGAFELLVECIGEDGVDGREPQTFARGIVVCGRLLGVSEVVLRVL